MPAGLWRTAPADQLVDRRELLLLTLLTGAYGLWFAELVPPDYRLINIAGPTVLAAALFAGAWWRVSRMPQAIWEPLFWFRIACAAYFGVGAVVPYIVNDFTATLIRSLHNFSDEEAFKVGLINVLCILTVLWAASFVALYWRPRKSARTRTLSRKQWMLSFAVVLLVGGGTVRYLILLPASLGIADDVPGLLVPLGRTYIVGLFLLVLSALRGSRLALLLALVLVPVELAVNVLTFAKTEVLITLIFVYLAVLHHRLSLPRVAIGLALVLGIYSQLDPIVHYGRDKLERQTGSSAQGSLAQRLEILGLYSGTAWQGTERAEIQSSLLRLSYLNAETMVVNWHDSAIPGDTLRNLLIVLVPRLVWPEKPNITDVGTDLYLAATNREGVSISAGWFGEAYWNFGWLGIPVLMVPLGAILALISQYARSVMLQERWLHLPSVLLSVLIGCRVDGWYVPDLIGASGTVLVYALLASGIERFLAQHLPRTTST